MELLLNEYGMFLGKRENRFVVRLNGKEQEFSADTVTQIILQAPCSVSASAVRLASENTIDIVYLDSIGRPYARVYPCKLGGTTLTRRKQLEAGSTAKSVRLAKAFVQGKLTNQRRFLKALGKSRGGLFATEANAIGSEARKIDDLDGTTVDSIRNVLLGLEGNAAAAYFSCLGRIVPFKRRLRKAGDDFNICLNYAYGVLYNEIEGACVLAGLDPYLGFLHTDRYGKPSMVLDLIEEFRSAIADRAIVTLLVQKRLSAADFEDGPTGRILSKQGRKKIVEALMTRLHTRITYRGKQISLKEAIREQARAIARYLLDQAPSYSPFVHTW
jgi:CRISPR-associated protein Cas1